MPLRWSKALRDAAIVVLLSAALALASNRLRPTARIPLVAQREYEVLVPCPEFEGRAALALDVSQLSPSERGLLLVDAREKAEFSRWHMPRALSIPYDYFEPKPEERKVLRTRARKVVVYGDGENPDSGQQLANVISGKGVKNVFYVKGGAPALRAASLERGKSTHPGRGTP